MATRRAQPVTPESDAEFEASAKPKRTRSAAAPKPEKVVELDAEGNPVKKGRRVMGDRNWLAREIDGIVRKADGPVTVREIVGQIANKEGESPSSGAVAACLNRWAEQGYITTTPKPLGFKTLPAKWKNSDFDTFLEKSREQRLTERRAAKAAATV